MAANIQKTDEQWREELTPEQYEILRNKGTERPFTGAYVDTKDDGTYACAACGHRFEVVHGVDGHGPETCPNCGGGPVRRAFAPPTVSRLLPFDAGYRLLGVGSDFDTPEILAAALPRPSLALVFATYAVVGAATGTMLLYRRDAS